MRFMLQLLLKFAQLVCYQDIVIMNGYQLSLRICSPKNSEKKNGFEKNCVFLILMHPFCNKVCLYN